MKLALFLVGSALLSYSALAQPTCPTEVEPEVTTKQQDLARCEGEQGVAARESAATSVSYESVNPNSNSYHEPRWSDFLPILGKEARERGYVLPLPFGISAVAFTQRQPFLVTNIGIEFAGYESNIVNGIVDQVLTPENLRVSDQTLNFRFDTWILPFWNVYGILGKTQGSAELDLRLSANSELNVPTVLLATQEIGGGPLVSGPNRCSNLNLNYSGNTSFPGGACVVSLNANKVYPTRLDFHGNVYGYGTTIAGGYGDFFGMFDVNYTEADINIARERSEQTVYSSRLGWNGTVGAWSGQVWVGAMKQRIKQVLIVDVPDTPIAAIISQEVSSPYSYLIGGSWNITPEWQIIAESSFLFSDRQQFMIQGSYRF
ncbi:hypothetical protein [Umboniibacter marinipuniceus]|uniref:Uncharacterized protein n=1 Tax=Umboniibacter marinipuniceus TaxID=569599 RepID=A0A3M0AA90_9GAMM|nr:hypothetical protein [Umboniibacter marinipuniceus]RMA82071.1 hypothetical protein DFR27_0018 [Umboniibacter marinipuniceus]